MKRLFFAIAIVFFIVCGGIYTLKRNKVEINTSESQPGRWNINRHEQIKDSHDETRDEAYDKLIGLGYLAGYKKATGLKNVTVFNKDIAQPGLNFFTSGHDPEAILMDMEGKILHRWRYLNAREIWGSVPENDPGVYYWRRAYLYKNGDILAIYEGIGLIKLDKNSNLLWSYTAPRAPHHDMEVLDNGTIYILTREKKKIPRISSADIMDEYITLLDAEGKLLQEYSLIEFIENSPYARLLDDDFTKAGGFLGHILHSNTLEVFDGSLAHLSPLFKKGNLLISILVTNTICIVDVERKQVVWALGSGMWKHQHQPTLLKNGNMLIFDNQDSDNASAVKEFNPFSQQIVWIYKGSSAQPFFSKTCGSNQRLANGNTLITETDSGRAFEVTPSGTIVWEYINPFRGGEKKELIASLFEMIRINPEGYTFIADRD